MAQGKPEGKKKGKQISVSPEAHDVMLRKAFNAKPKKQTVRQLINIMNGLPENL